MFSIYEVTENKKQYLDLLLLADEQEDMIDRYLDEGTMFVLAQDGEVKGECVVTDEGDGVLEIKNIAVSPDSHGQGLGRKFGVFQVEQHEGVLGRMYKAF